MRDLLLQQLEIISVTNGKTNENHVNGGYYKARKSVNLSRFITEGKYFLIPTQFRCPENRHPALARIP